MCRPTTARRGGEYRRLRGNVDTEDVWHEAAIELGTVSEVQIRFRGYMSGASEDAYVDKVLIETM